MKIILDNTYIYVIVILRGGEKLTKGGQMLRYPKGRIRRVINYSKGIITMDCGHTKAINIRKAIPKKTRCSHIDCRS